MCANPVRSVKAEAGSKDRGKVCALNVEQQKQWLLERAEKWGFSLDERFELVARDLKRFPHGERAVTLSVAFFEGLLTVRDAAILRKAMIVGIGRAKAYGCGMLTLARPA